MTIDTTQTTKAYGTDASDKPMHPLTINRRELLANDIAMDVLYCGVCHSDLHAVRNDWGGTSYPIVPGHEIVGRITRIGSDVSKFKVGDIAAIGCIVDACESCHHCETNLEQFCDEGVTYSFNSPDKTSGGMTFGGFSEKHVCDEKYVLKMPAFDDLAAAAPLLCAGITVYSPLKHWQAAPGKKIGILGIGGLGHVAIKIAKAMGADIVVFTTSAKKADDARRLGADEVVLSSDETQMAQYARSLDFILDTVSAKHDINAYLNLLKHDGSIVVVGLPPEPIEVSAFSIVMGRRSVSGSNIGSIAETQEMLEFCAEHKITADIELIDVEQIEESFDRLETGDVRYRFVVDMASLNK